MSKWKYLSGLLEAFSQLLWFLWPPFQARVSPANPSSDIQSYYQSWHELAAFKHLILSKGP